MARLALHLDVAAHQAAEVPADGEPRPVLRVVEIRLGEFLEQPAHLIVAHADAGIGHGDRNRVAAIDLERPRRDGDSAFSVNLLALLARLSSACRNRIWSAWMAPRSPRAVDHHAIAVLRRHRLDRLGHVLDDGASESLQ